MQYFFFFNLFIYLFIFSPCFVGLNKQLNAASKIKECDLIGAWRKSIISHLYWSATSTPSGNGDVMAAKFRSIANHVKNKHDGHGEHPDVQQCAHEEIEREWFREGMNLCLHKILIRTIPCITVQQKSRKLI